MNGLVNIVRRRFVPVQRTFHSLTAEAIRFNPTDAAATTLALTTTTTVARVVNVSIRRLCRYSDVARGDGTDRPESKPESRADVPVSNPRSSLERPTESLWREKILSNTALSRQHMVPEIALRLITPDCAIYHQPVGASRDPSDTGFPLDPFWGFFWPGGQALTRFILDTGHVFRGKTVLDVGCGCGASTIAALLVGANRVTANDIDPVALQATLLNVELNGIVANRNQVVISDDNLISGGARGWQDDYEVVLIGDLFYDTEIAAELHPWIQRLARAGVKIFIGDPGRHGITETGVLRHMTLRARYELPEHVCLENNGFSHANVWQFLPTQGQ
ncbi:electron transfer flavoprotein beta subunit lysine methyltransferase-like [Anopheles nili]|uniref:electron transfer flavoprotein beta subunit lysine methyltransferase-like n=1 Tax=Anopheles nili TaxID=185578 RepID=UPI00237BE8FB|nr:electron transfer flavoprotein beta subunit lysine methyltransferase-like [Anopheles nili]